MNERASSGSGSKLLACLYGPLTEALPEQLNEFARYAISEFSSFGLNVTNISCASARSLPQIENHKTYEFAVAGERILTETQCGNVQQLTIESIPTESSYVALDWKVYLSCGVSSAVRLNVFTFGVDAEVLGQRRRILGFSDICQTVKRAAAIVHPRYGFMTIMPRAFLPAGYAVGLAGRAPDELVWDANSWSRGAWQAYDTQLRNVHGANIVTSEHLDQPVGDQRLRDWIEADHARGRLTSWADALELWSFEFNEQWPAFLRWDQSSQRSARLKLQEFGLFPWQKFIKRFLTR